MAAPIMFSAITTGPDTPKTVPYRDSRSSSRIYRGCPTVEEEHQRARLLAATALEHEPTDLGEIPLGVLESSGL